MQKRGEGSSARDKCELASVKRVEAKATAIIRKQDASGRVSEEPGSKRSRCKNQQLSPGVWRQAFRTLEMKRVVGIAVRVLLSLAFWNILARTSVAYHFPTVVHFLPLWAAIAFAIYALISIITSVYSLPSCRAEYRELTGDIKAAKEELLAKGIKA